MIGYTCVLKQNIITRGILIVFVTESRAPQFSLPKDIENVHRYVYERKEGNRLFTVFRRKNPIIEIMVKISDGRVAAKGDSNFTDKSSYSFEDKKLFFIKSILHIPEVYILYVRF